MMSSQTVNYDSFIKIIKENANLLRVPMWVIGLDIEDCLDSRLSKGDDNPAWVEIEKEIFWL